MYFGHGTTNTVTNRVQIDYLKYVLRAFMLTVIKILLNRVLKLCFELYLKCILRRIHSQSYKHSSNRLFEICFKSLNADRILNPFK